MKMLNVVCIYSFSIIALNCTNPTSQVNLQTSLGVIEEKIENLSPEQLKNQLRLLEESNPVQHIEMTTSFTPNRILVQKPTLFSKSKYANDGYLLTGVIKNNASIAKFKDAEIVITFLSETNTSISSNNLILYKYLNPNEPISFEFKVYPPDGTKDYKITIKTARPV